MASNEMRSGSIFWILAFAISIIVLIYIGLWSYQEGSIKGIAVALIFSMMLFGAAIISRDTLFNSGTWSQNSLSFSLGFIIWAWIGGASSKSVLSTFSVEKNTIFASIASELPLFLEFVMNSFLIPIAEEALWIIALPDLTKWTMDKISDVDILSFFENKWFQLVTIMVITSATFAYFHVGKLFTAFIISAIIFRSVLIFFVVGDGESNILPWLTLTAAFAVGAHIGNNWADFGILQGTQLMLQNGFIGFAILGGLFIIFFSGFGQILNFVVDIIGGDTR